MKTKPAAFPHRIIRASAGTGKTFQLSNRFLGLLHDGAPGDSILATTFTRKAAGEILDRVLQRLAKAALDDREATQLGEHLEISGLTRERCLELITAAARQLHRLRIGTLDSFFAQIAHSFGLELGLPPGWQIVDEAEDARLRREAVAAVLRVQETRDLKTLMNHLTKGDSTRGVAELVRTTVDSLYGLYLETSPEAWHSLPRQKSLSPEELQSTLVALRDAALPNGKMKTARDANVESAAAADWHGFISKGLAAKVLDGSRAFNRAEIPQPVVALYDRLLVQARAELVGKLVLQTEGTYQLLEKFDVQYQRLKRERRAMRFEDVTRRLADVALMGDVGRLAFRLDAHLDHLLLDEFQDTSPPQWRVVRAFAERVTDGTNRRSFFCVGDVKQAIYGWRGGVAEIFDAVARELPGLAPLSLTRSFRSSQPVIDAVNQVFSRLKSHTSIDRETKGIALWSERFEGHTTQHEKLSGYVCLETAPLADEDEEAKVVRLEFAARRIAEIVKQAPGRPVGVLLRSNEGVARLVFELRRLGVPASEEGGNPLTDSAAVQVVLSLLRLADHPGDRIARFHVENSPLARQAASLPHVAEAASFGDGSFDSLRVSQAIRRDLVDHGYGPTLQRWAQSLAPHCNRRELSRLVQLVELAYGYDARATLRTTDFIAQVQSQRVPDPSGADVRVMTIHQAKGLEFEIVVLPQLDARLIGQSDSFVVNRPDPAGPVQRVCRYANESVRQLLPADVQQMFLEADDRDVTESLCLLYVALTRSSRALYLVIPPSAKNERTLPKTFAGLLRASLYNAAAAPEKTKLYECGDPRWFEQDDDKPERGKAEPAAKAVRPPKPLVVQLAPAALERTRGFQRVAPSGLEGGTKVKLSAVLNRRENAGALDRGTLVHAWFEQITWLDDGRPDEQTLRAVGNRALDPTMAAHVSVDKVLPEFLAMLDKPAIAGALSRATYAAPRELGLPAAVEQELLSGPLRIEVQNERQFALRYEGTKLLQGSIDRLVLLYSGERLIAADILDYKTDAIPTGDASALREKIDYYRPQLQAYRHAVAQMFGLAENRVTARLLFVGLGANSQVN